MIKKILKLFLFSSLLIAVFTFGYLKYYNMNINDLGLQVLGWVKKLKGNAVNLAAINNAETKKMEHSDWTILLNKHVTKAGNVNYKGFIQDSVLLQNYLDKISGHLPGNNWTDNEKMAYWINAYNAYTVKLIVDNYPLKSIKEIGDGLPMIDSPWDIKFFKIGNQDFDLNTIEHEILRKNFEEPRIHFAINCASFSCPKLRNEAFTADKLENQLEEQANSFINNPDKNVINENETKLSKIFNWFESDFLKKSSLTDFIKKHAPLLNEKNKVEFVPYNWTLNE